MNLVFYDNSRDPKQVELMRAAERRGYDPLDPMYLSQGILEVYRGWYVTNNAFPYSNAKQHLLFVPVRPVYDLEGLSRAEIFSLYDLLQKYRSSSGDMIFLRFGDPRFSGASLRRLHVHLIEPKSGFKTTVKIKANSFKEENKND